MPTLVDPYVGAKSKVSAARFTDGRICWQWIDKANAPPSLILYGVKQIGGRACLDVPISAEATGLAQPCTWELCEETPAHQHLLRKWARREGFSIKWDAPRRRATPREIEWAVAQVESGASRAEVASALGFTPQLIGLWCKKVGIERAAPATEEEIEILLKKGSTYREITKQTGARPRRIKSIITKMGIGQRIKRKYNRGGRGINTNVYLPAEMVEETAHEAGRLGVSISRIIQEAWTIARGIQNTDLEGCTNGEPTDLASHPSQETPPDSDEEGLS